MHINEKMACVSFLSDALETKNDLYPLYYSYGHKTIIFIGNGILRIIAWHIIVRFVPLDGSDDTLKSINALMSGCE